MNASSVGAVVVETCVCPCCRGVIGFLELHQPHGPAGPTYATQHLCQICASKGVVTRTVARSYWLAQAPCA